MGNRKLNAALHQVVLTQARVHPPARAYLAKKRAEGKSNKEAFRCLKRHLVRVVFGGTSGSRRSQRPDRATPSGCVERVDLHIPPAPARLVAIGRRPSGVAHQPLRHPIEHGLGRIASSICSSAMASKAQLVSVCAAGPEAEPRPRALGTSQ